MCVSVSCVGAGGLDSLLLLVFPQPFPSPTPARALCNVLGSVAVEGPLGKAEEMGLQVSEQLLYCPPAPYRTHLPAFAHALPCSFSESRLYMTPSHVLDTRTGR